MKIFVTGVAGFIGSHLADFLIKRGDVVVGLDNLNDYYDPSLKLARLDRLNHERFQFIKGDLQNKILLDSLFKANKFDVVVNLAAQAGVRYSIENPSAYIDSNIVGFLNILECCRSSRVGHLVYASSSSVYGLNREYPFSESHNVDHPVSLYAATKKSNELMAHAYSHLYDIPTTGLRFFTVYGPWGRPDMAYFSFTKNIFENRAIKVFNKGDMERDFTFIDDIIAGVVSVIDEPAIADPTWDGQSPNPSTSTAPYRIYNIGNNKPVRLLDFIELIEKSAKRKAKKNFLPMQSGDVQATFANIDELNKLSGFVPKTELDEGIDKFVTWYKQYYSL